LGRHMRVKFLMTSQSRSVMLVRITQNPLHALSRDIKKLFVLSVLVSSAMICSCQQQGTSVEQQLAQRKADLAAREKALDEREKALAEREQAVAAAKTLPANVQPRALARDPEQLKAEREKRLQQLPPELQGLIADPARTNADREKRMQE